MPRSNAAATRIASAEAPLAGAAATAFNAGRTAAARRGGFATALEAGFAARLGDDIKILAFLHRLVLFQLHLAVADALAGLHVVFHAVPRADKVHLVFGEEQAHRGLVGAQPLLDLGDGQALAGRAALVQAEIAVGVEFALVPEHADLVVAHKDDPPIAVLEFRKLCDELFRHLPYTSGFTLLAAVSVGGFLTIWAGLSRRSATHAFNTDQNRRRRA